VLQADGYLSVLVWASVSQLGGRPAFGSSFVDPYRSRPFFPLVSIGLLGRPAAGRPKAGLFPLGFGTLFLFPTQGFFCRAVGLPGFFSGCWKWGRGSGFFGKPGGPQRGISRGGYTRVSAGFFRALTAIQAPEEVVPNKLGGRGEISPGKGPPTGFLNPTKGAIIDSHQGWPPPF